jgi:hypothetical protein
MQAGEGESGHMLATSEQYDNIRKRLADIRVSLADINAGKGSMGQFTQTDVTYRQMQRLVNTLDEMVDSVRFNEGRFGALLADSQLYESLTGSTGELRQAVSDFQKNPRKYLRLKVF